MRNCIVKLFYFKETALITERSFMYLRRQAQIRREQIIEKKVEERLVNPAVGKYTGSMTTVPKIKVDGRNSEGEVDEIDDDDESWFSACSTTSILEASDIRSFRCQSHHVRGRLIIFSKGIRFVRSLPKKELWRLDYLDLAEMRKVEGSTMSKLATLSPDQLEIKSIDGSKFHLEAMKERDSAFNSIVGFSGLQWQSLQILSSTKAQP